MTRIISFPHNAVLAYASISYMPCQCLALLLSSTSMEDEEKTVLYLRDFPKDLARQVRAAAILSGRKMTDYIAEVLSQHLARLEQQGRTGEGIWYSTLHKAGEKTKQRKGQKKD